MFKQRVEYEKTFIVKISAKCLTNSYSTIVKNILLAEDEFFPVLLVCGNDVVKNIYTVDTANILLVGKNNRQRLRTPRD